MTTEETATKDAEHMIYLDNLGRLLMGKKLIDQCTDNTVVIKNPVIIVTFINTYSKRMILVVRANFIKIIDAVQIEK